MTQWEVARKRAGVGGATMMTAQSAPWFEFALHGRVAARHFRPVPSVDGGILSNSRRASPLVNPRDRGRYDRVVRDAVTGAGGKLAAVVPTALFALGDEEVSAARGGTAHPRSAVMSFAAPHSEPMLARSGCFASIRS
ncbi:hypothetical protein [Microbacterium sp. zg-B185]|uniref:hypothetical protein n=1 Tax=unclassified Microbacterium TaxID=2609290 RepID=UPI00214D027A|nr:hypothetical protein [Microbacterium sp. zg-B185]MCR2809076.1 hypothetical protein [Microbacterium sp. zg.B185]WIM20818.1 hypothetical protein QNO12_05355 [Microbacterium sp. zg-B185]